MIGSQIILVCVFDDDAKCPWIAIAEIDIEVIAGLGGVIKEAFKIRDAGPFLQVVRQKQGIGMIAKFIPVTDFKPDTPVAA